MLVGQDHYSARENVLPQETAAVSTAILSSVWQERTARTDGHKDVDEDESKTK